MGQKTSPMDRPFRCQSSVVEMAELYFEPHRDRPPASPRGTLGFCYIATGIGTLEIHLDTLLALVASMLSTLSPYKPGKITKISEDDVEAAMTIIQRIPDYMANDFIGMTLEASFDQSGRRKKRPTMWRSASARLTGSSGKAFKLKFLNLLFAYPGILALEIDDVRTAFKEVCSKDGAIGPQWEKFVRNHVVNKKGPGRPRNREYDALFEKYANLATTTYGKLVRELTNPASVTTDVARNRLKSAAAYRRKKTSLTSRPATP
jgi:hypothetical protein